jgi:hypothetical protein
MLTPALSPFPDFDPDTTSLHILTGHLSVDCDGHPTAMR